MSDLIRRQDAIDLLEKVAELYPWRVPGDRDSYSKYNEAWNDALDRAESEIEALPSAQPDVPDTNVGDTISRQVVVDTVHKIILGFFSEKKRRNDRYGENASERQ